MAGLSAARTAVAGVLREHLPKSWRIHDDETVPDTLDRTTVLASITHVGRLPAAPLGAWDITVQLTLASAKSENLPAAEAELLEHLGTLLAVVEDNMRTPWEPATKAMFAGRYLCWDIPLHVTINRTE